MRGRFALHGWPKLSFGLDWGSHCVKFVGIKKVGSNIELTHCVMFDIPKHASLRHIEPIIRRRLEKIRFYGGRVTVVLPATDVRPRKNGGGTLREKGRKYLNRIFRFWQKEEGEMPDYEVSEDVVRKEWVPRARVVGRAVRAELEGFPFSLLARSGADEMVAFLEIGQRHGVLVVVKGREVVHHQPLPLAMEDLIPAEYRNDPGAESKVLEFLRSIEVRIHDRRVRFVYSSNQEDLDVDAVRHHLKIFFRKLERFLLEVRNRKGAGELLTFRKLYLAGGGALFPWLPSLLARKLAVPVEILRPITGVIHSAKGFNSGRLQYVEPLFAEAMAAALSGLEGPKRKGFDIGPQLKWFLPWNWHFARGFRKTALSLAMLSLLAFLGLSARYNHLAQEDARLRLLVEDYRTEIRGVKQLLRFSLAGLPSERWKPKIPGSERISPVLAAISESIPVGAWIDRMDYVPAGSIREFRLRRMRTAPGKMAVRIHGRAISENYISEFYNSLYQSGYFTQLILKRPDGNPEIAETLPFLILARVRDDL